MRSVAAQDINGLRQPKKCFVVFLLRGVLRWRWETEMKSRWWVMLYAAGVKRDARIALPAAGNGGAFGLSPTKSVQHASIGTMPHAL